MTEGGASHDILSDKMAGHEWLRRMILVVLALMLAGFGAAIRQGDWGVFRLAVLLTRIC